MDPAPPDPTASGETRAEVRKAGVLVAVHAPEPRKRAGAIELLKLFGAQDIEIADGEWHNGTWLNFDPVAPRVPN
jgi:hypothetical protein